MPSAVVVALALIIGAVARVPTVEAQSPPGTPASVTVTRGNGTLTVTWSAVAGATGYNINTTADHKASWQRAASNVTGTSTTLTGLNNAAAYYVAVQAVNANGSGGWRNSDLIPALQTPTAPASVSLTRGSGYLDVAWTMPSSDGGSAITGYDIVLSDDGQKSWQRAFTGANPTPVNGTYTQRVNTGIADAAAYHVAVRAVSAAGGGPWKNAGPIAAIANPPAAPASVTVYRGANFLDVTWPAVTDATGYNVVYRADPGGSWTRAATNISTTSYTIPNIPNNATYIVGVQAVSAGGSGPWRNSAPNDQALDPYPAEDIEVTRPRDELWVSWTQCDVSLEQCNGGSPVTGYLINLSIDGGASWTQAKTLATYTSGTTVTLDSGITNAIAYLVAVGVESRMGTKWTNVSVGAYTP